MVQHQYPAPLSDLVGESCGTVTLARLWWWMWRSWVSHGSPRQDVWMAHFHGRSSACSQSSIFSPKEENLWLFWNRILSSFLRWRIWSVFVSLFHGLTFFPLHYKVPNSGEFQGRIQIISEYLRFIFIIYLNFEVKFLFLPPILIFIFLSSFLFA